MHPTDDEVMAAVCTYAGPDGRTYYVHEDGHAFVMLGRPTRVPVLRGLLDDLPPGCVARDYASEIVDEWTDACDEAVLAAKSQAVVAFAAGGAAPPPT